MDPRIAIGGAGLAPDSCNPEEDMNYPHQQAGEVAGVPADAATTGLGQAPTDPTSFAWKERRQSPRIRCSGSVELQIKGNDVSMWGTLTDISLHGCYVEINNTFPVETGVCLVLKSFGFRIHTPGTVRTSYPSQGMGIGYAEMEPLEEKQLRQLLYALTGTRIVPDSTPARENSAKTAVGWVHAIAFFDELTEFFVKNQVLSREEFHKIAKRILRS